MAVIFILFSRLVVWVFYGRCFQCCGLSLDYPQILSALGYILIYTGHSPSHSGRRLAAAATAAAAARGRRQTVRVHVDGRLVAGHIVGGGAAAGGRRIVGVVVRFFESDLLGGKMDILNVFRNRKSFLLQFVL